MFKMYFKKTLICGNVVDGSADLIGDIPDFLLNHFISITFFKDSSPVTPSAGDIEFSVTDDGHNWGSIPNGSVSITGGDYSRPNFSGFVQKMKAKVSGVTGVDSVRITVSSGGSK